MASPRNTALQSILIVPDVHVPFHDKRAWRLMLKVARVLKPYYLAAVGDVGDFYAVSNHDKNPERALRLDTEVAEVRAALDDLDALGAKHKLLCGSNHHIRLQRYLETKAPELNSVLNEDALFGLSKRGWLTCAYRDHAEMAGVTFTHDVGSAGKNAVWRVLELFKGTSVTGHTHRMAYVAEGDLEGNRRISAMFGWLGDVKQIDYMSRAKAMKEWQLGFGVGYFCPATGAAYLVPVPILADYSCVVNGILYRE